MLERHRVEGIDISLLLLSRVGFPNTMHLICSISVRTLVVRDTYSMTTDEYAVLLE